MPLDDLPVLTMTMDWLSRCLAKPVNFQVLVYQVFEIAQGMMQKHAQLAELDQ